MNTEQRELTKLTASCGMWAIAHWAFKMAVNNNLGSDITGQCALVAKSLGLMVAEQKKAVMPTEEAERVLNA